MANKSLKHDYKQSKKGHKIQSSQITNTTLKTTTTQPYRNYYHPPTVDTMLYKSIIIVLVSTVAQVAVLAETSSSRLGQNAPDIDAAEDVVLQTSSVKKLKKDNNKSNKNKNDNDEDEEEEEVEEIVNNSVNFTPIVRSNILAVEETDWSGGTYAVSSARSGSFKVYVPAETRVGDTLFLFLR